MKIKNLLLFIIGSTIILSSCGQSLTGNVSLKTDLDTLSYALGSDVANSLKQMSLEEINYDAFVKGMTDVFEEKELKLDAEKTKMFIQQYFTKMQEQKHNKNLKEGRAFLEENKKKEGIFVTESGLQYGIITEGTGISPVPTDTVVAHYHGTLIDGTVFDSSVGKDGPIPTFPLNKVIPGWTEGLQLMKVGAKYKFYIPTEIAYGKNVRPGGKIEPNMALVFEVELIEVKKGPANTEN